MVSAHSKELLLNECLRSLEEIAICPQWMVPYVKLVGEGELHLGYRHILTNGFPRLDTNSPKTKHSEKSENDVV